MKTVVQRVTRAQVSVDGAIVAAVARGVMLLVGVEKGDGEADADATARKIAALRIFPSPSTSPGKAPMDLTLAEIGGGCLVVSQFTLCASLAKGNRPSFEPAEAPARAEALYLRVAEGLRAAGLLVALGRFGADMAVELVNDGPVTFLVVARDGALVKS
ncbi:MAG TPA: D-aminoacyl-tRNA deacylase [Polyangia bacterium]|nr:D-aminoacyl-tRNA deacylase [Polyangia bacterium]